MGGKPTGENKMKTNKKLITSILVGALAISAPLSAFASQGFNENQINKQQFNSDINYSQEDIENRINLLSSALDLQIEHANTLIDDLDLDSDVNVDELREIIDEFAQLELTLNELDISEIQKDEFRTIFLEYQDESKELSSQFKDIIQDAFSYDEIQSYREEFKLEKEQLRGNYSNYGTNAGNKMNGGNNNSQQEIKSSNRGQMNNNIDKSQFDDMTEEEIEEKRAEMRELRGLN